MNVIDLFSGVGGFSTGFKKANYNIVLANEIDKTIAKSYKINHPETIMINKDIKDFASNIDQEIIEYLKKVGPKQSSIYESYLNNIDVIIGGPPCQGFSMAGKRIRKNKEFIEDPRNYLFKYYFEVLKYFEPEFFVFENVQGLLNIKNGDILNEIISIFEDEKSFKNGKYNVDYYLVDTSKLGIPQKRKRLLIVGSKSYNINLKDELSKYIKEDVITLRDAISDLNYLNTGEGLIENIYLNDPLTQYQIERRKNSDILFNHVAPVHDENTLRKISLIKEGENFKNLPENERTKSVHSGAYGRMEWNKPSYTITTRFDTPSAGRVIHPDLNRALTPREAARIQSFDDDFIFIGNKTSIGKQIGNAVPPLLGKIIAEILNKIVKRENQ